MQDRYAGDVGDFGKLGMLRSIENSGLTVGINWYLVGDEFHNNDGKHVEYLEDKKYCGCDDELLVSLKIMIEHDVRSVCEIEKLNLLNTRKYYHERIIAPHTKNGNMRTEWHQKGLDALAECDLVLLDPDNGMLPKSVSRGCDKSIKYVFPEEILDYYEAGHSVVFYSHRTREQLDIYLERFGNLFDDAEKRGAKIKGITFKRVNIRDYFFVLHEKHVKQVEEGLAKLLSGNWNQHFTVIQIPNKDVMKNALLPFFIRVEKVVTEIINAANKAVQSKSVQTLIKGFLGLQEIIKLGEENNWVVIIPEIDMNICEKTQEEIDEYFVNYIDQEDGIYQKIKNRITSSTLLTEKNNLLCQIFSAIEMKHYALAGMPLASLIEYMLALDVGYDRFRIEVMINDFKNRVGEISIDEEGLLPAFGLDGFLKNFSFTTNGFSKEKEPGFVNRHWIAHGRMHRDLTKVDVYQMLCAIYALDVVIETEQRFSGKYEVSGANINL